MNINFKITSRKPLPSDLVFDCFQITLKNPELRPKHHEEIKKTLERNGILTEIL